MATAYVALGSNLGERLTNLRQAVGALRLLEGTHVDPAADLAPVYETVPVGGPSGQARFFNSVARVHTALPARDLLAEALRIEGTLGRSRVERWGPRVIDLDLLLYDDRVIDEPGLVLPHPRMADRRFVLAPLADLAAGLVHPVLRLTVAELLARLGRATSEQEIVRVCPGGWFSPGERNSCEGSV